MAAQAAEAGAHFLCVDEKRAATGPVLGEIANALAYHRITGKQVQKQDLNSVRRSQAGVVAIDEAVEPRRE